MTTDKTLHDFEGTWRFDRTIRHADGTRVGVTGTAVLSWSGKDLAYHETGKMRMGQGPAMDTSRRYLWQPGLNILFEDGRFFHAIPAAGGQAEHWCDPDTYRVMYTFSDWPRWSALWQVSGPRKDYEMITRYRPAGAL